MNITYNTFKTLIKLLTFSLIIGCGRSEKDTELFFIQGNVAYKKGNYEEAIKFYTEAIDKTPKFADAYNNRGSVKLAMDNIAGAISDFEEAVSIDNKFYMAKYNLAEVYSRGNDKIDESIDLLRQISVQYKDSSFYYVTLSNALIAKNNFSEASSNLAMAIKLDDKNDKAFTNVGFINYSDKNYTTAKQNFEKALLINPKQDFALNNLSLIYAQEENYTKALETIEKAIILNKSDVYQNNKGYYLLNLGKLEDGKNIIENVLTIDKSNAWAYRNLGFYYLKTKDFTKAQINFEQCDKLNPAVELLNYYMGLTQQSLGNKTEACKYWSIGQKLNEQKSIEMLAKVCK